MARRLVVGVSALAALALVAPATAGASGPAPARAQAAATTLTTWNCWLYVPMVVLVLPPSPVPGQTVTLAGRSVPLETVTLTIGQTGRPPIVTTSATTNALGLYATSVTIPVNAPPGRYTVTVVSPYCGPQYAQFNVRYPDNRCADYRESSATRGVTSVWQLLSLRRYNKPVTVTLVPESGGTSRRIFTGTAPALAFVTWFPAPAWAPGWYTVSEVGTSDTSNATRTANCGRVRIS